MNTFLQRAEPIVRQAGVMAKQMAGHAKTVAHKRHGDFVTEGDLAVEDLVIPALRKLFPDHGFDSEERDAENAQAEYVWVLDPIDGTKYYAKDVPLYSISLALKHRGEENPILGVVYGPEIERMYCGAVGEGATLNGRTIRCSAETDLENAAICLEMPSRDCTADQQRWAIDKLSVLIARAYRVRVIGVAALGLCFCAAGGFDAYVNLGSIWKDCDNAAGQVILREAGGEFRFVGEARRQIVAGPPALCEKIRLLLDL